MALKDRLNAITKQVQAGAAKKKAAPAYDRKSGKTPGNIFGKGAPNVISGGLDRDEGLSILKAAAYTAGQIPAENCKSIVDMSNRLKSIYMPYYPFQPFNTVLVPVSAALLPTKMANGIEIPGAEAIKKEVKQRLEAGVEGYDPDEAEFYRRKTGLATKALNTMVDTAGGSAVQAPVLGDLIDLQRNMEVFSRAGASNTDLPPNGRIQFPKLTGGSTVYWVGETASVTASQQTTGVLNLEAKKLAVRVPLTVELMRFSSPSIEGMVRQDMALQAALAADLAMLQGTGGTQIKGLITYPTASSWQQGIDALLAYTVTNSVFQPEDVAEMEAMLPDGMESTSWAMRPDMWAKIYTRRGDAVTAADGKGPFVFDMLRSIAAGGVDQFGAAKLVKSRQISNTRGTGSQTYLLTGYFPDWIIARMGVMEFMVDPYTQMQQLQTVIQAIQFIDAGPRHASSFVFADGVNIE